MFDPGVQKAGKKSRLVPNPLQSLAAKRSSGGKAGEPVAPAVLRSARQRGVKRKHGPSRLEKLLQDSIRQELQIKRLQQLLVTLSFRLALVESQRERQ